MLRILSKYCPNLIRECRIRTWRRGEWQNHPSEDKWSSRLPCPTSLTNKDGILIAGVNVDVECFAALRSLYRFKQLVDRLRNSFRFPGLTVILVRLTIMFAPPGKDTSPYVVDPALLIFPSAKLSVIVSIARTKT